MRSADVALTPTCEECGDVWLPTDDRRWQAHRIDVEPDEEPARSRSGALTAQDARFD